MSNDRVEEAPEDASGHDGAPGVGTSGGGDRDNDHFSEEQSAGYSTSGDGSGVNGGHRGSSAPERVRWAGVVAAFVTVVVILTQIWGDITGNQEQSEQIINKVQQLPEVVDRAEELKDAVTNLQNQVEELPTPTETTIIQKGEPGQPGKPGEVVTAPPKTVIVEKPGKTVTVRPSPQPTCRTSLLGTCVAP